MATTPTSVLRPLRTAPSPLARSSGPTSYLELPRWGLLSAFLLLLVVFVVTDKGVEALGITVTTSTKKSIAGILFFAGTAFYALLFGIGSLVRNRRIDWTQYVSLFSPGARLWFAIAFTLVTALTCDLMLGAPGKNRLIPGWLLSLSFVALYYFVPVWLAKRIAVPKGSRASSGAFGLFLGTSTGTFGNLSHGAGIKGGQRIVLSLEDAAQNILVLGGIGSGKTTRAIQPLLTQLLDQDCGGLIFDVKGDFKQAVSALAQDADREIVTIGPEKTRMNLLSGLTPEVASSFLKSAFLLNQGGSFEAFWVDTATELSKNALGVLSFLPGKYSLSGLYQYLYDKDERASIDDALSLLISSGQLSERNQRLLKTYQGYHDAVFSSFEDKVKSGVNATIAQILSPFNHPDLIDAFCTDDSSAPSMEAVLDGVVYLVDMPTARWGLGGRVAYNFIKLRFFNVLQRRNVEESWNKYRPVFFMCDEYQEVVSASRDGLSDLNFWDKSRSSKCIGIISGQAVSSFYAAIGSHDLANTLMQNFRQKICFRTEDKTTIETLNHLLGRVELEKVSTSVSKTTPTFLSKNHPSTTDSKSKSMIERQVVNPQLFRQLEPNQAVALLSMGGRAMDDVVKCVPVFVS